MNDKHIRQDIIDELDWDPSIDSANIGVAVDNGVATLTGHLSNYAQKFAAERAAQRVRSVRAVAGEIEVRFPGAVKHDDEQIAGQAASVLSWDVLLPKGAIKVKVSKGFVTLTGEVDWEYQRRAAELDVHKLPGVTAISNQVSIKLRVSPADIRTRIEGALKRDAYLEADGVKIVVDSGRVKLEGKVRTWRERGAVERAAWAAPGVRMVEDHLAVG